MTAFSAQSVIDILRSVGTDPSRRHAFNFYLYLPTEALAADAAAELGEAGFRCEVRPPLPGYDTWLCLASAGLVPTDEALAAIGAQFEALAEDLGGDFDGWEAEIVAH